jgi:hypothetical protein
MILRCRRDPGADFLAGRRSRWHGRIRLPGVIGLAVLALGTASCTAPADGRETVQGHQVVLIYPDAANVSFVYPGMHDGTPVIVRDDQGHRVSSGKLVFNMAATGQDQEKFINDPENGGDFVAVFDFTVAVPPGLKRYGITVGTGHGEAWFTSQQMLAGPVLTLGSLNGSDNPVSCPAASGHVSAECADVAGGHQFVPGG